jgi:methylamine utilization protein MauE
MLRVIAAVQPVLLAGVLIPAASIKLFGRHAADGARATALASLLGTTRALPVYRLLGGLELLIGTMLVVPPARTANAVAATALAIGFLGYLGYARRFAPESSCGCLHSRRSIPVSWRSFARGVLLVIAGLLATQTTSYWLDVVVTHPLTATAALTVEAVVVILLSPELGWSHLMRMRHLRSRVPRPLLSRSGLTLHSTVWQLQHSPAYQKVAGLVHPDIVDSWDHAEWRILCYKARYHGRPATAAFAVPLRRYDPGMVRVALVDEFAGVTLLSSAAASLPTPTES